VKLGDLYHSQNIDKSIHYYTRAVKFFPRDISIRLKLSHLFKEISQFDKALEILVIKPEDQEDLKENGLVNIDGNNIIIDKEIIQQFKEFKEINKQNTKLPIEVEKIKNISEDNNFQFNYDENENLLSDNNFTKEYLNIKIDDENIHQQNSVNSEENQRESNEENNVPKENMSMILNKSPEDNILDPEQYMDLYENRIFQETSHKSSKKQTTFLSKKRIKTSHSNFVNYNFENYLFRRNSKLLSKEAYTLTSIRLEFEEINNNLPKIKNTYIKLQESLIYFQSNNIDKFLETTFTPLKQTLITELKIEELKNRVFENFLAKSNIKNYFKKTTNILDENRSKINETSERDEIKDETDGALLFLRKTNSNSISLLI
jgi:Fe-S cluster biosynthesis and repair protein YggX